MKPATVLATLLACAILVHPGCGSRKRYVINKALDSSGTRFMGEVELEASAGHALIEVTDHEDAYAEVQLTCKRDGVMLRNVVFHFEDGGRMEVDGEREFTEDEPHWEIELTETGSAVKSVEFDVHAEPGEEYIVKLYGFVQK
jgi:hypothetical protein